MTDRARCRTTMPAIYGSPFLDDCCMGPASGSGAPLALLAKDTDRLSDPGCCEMWNKGGSVLDSLAPQGNGPGPRTVRPGHVPDWSVCCPGARGLRTNLRRSSPHATCHPPLWERKKILTCYWEQLWFWSTTMVTTNEAALVLGFLISNAYRSRATSSCRPGTTV